MGIPRNYGRSPMRRALAFLTPIGRAEAPTPDTAAWFPVVGAVLGLVIGLTWWGAAELWPPLVAASIVVAVDLALTGMLHLDGLCDAADGLLPPLERDRRLEVMATPDVGAFGMGAAAATLLLRWSAFATVDADPLLIAGLWCLSRTTMIVTMAVVPYARPGGLASAFLGDRSLGAAVGGTLAAVALATAGAGLAGLAGTAACAVAAAAVVALARRRLGGFTGDVLGAAGMVAETAGLVIVAAW